MNKSSASISFTVDVPPRVVKHRMELSRKQVEEALRMYIKASGVEIPKGSFSTFWVDKNQEYECDYFCSVTIEEQDHGEP